MSIFLPRNASKAQLRAAENARKNRLDIWTFNGSVPPKLMQGRYREAILFRHHNGTGTGSDVMKRIAAPMIGGIVTSFLLELVVYPALYEIWKWDLGLKRWLSVRRQVAAGGDIELDMAPASN
jgi:hypothetical protein